MVMAPVYLSLCQQYVSFFCTEAQPDKFHTPIFPTPLSERWHRVVIQQAAGIAQSWRTNRANAYQDYLDDLLDYHEQQTEGILEEGVQEPVWKEWDVPTLRQACIQANVNVVELEPSHDSTFDYWLQISTLEFRKPLLVPVKLAVYHKDQITDPKTGKVRKLNTSVTLNKREDGGWWVTLSYDEIVTVHTEPDAPVIGVDVGIANFVTTSDGRQSKVSKSGLNTPPRRLDSDPL
jgi:hypothetical protein